MSVLASELADTLSLDYQRSSHPTQYPTNFLDITLDISPRLATLASHIPPHFSPQGALTPPSRVCYCSIGIGEISDAILFGAYQGKRKETP